MITEYQLTNFKAFAGPETLPIKPITLIFGANSSGKSSIFQSLLMLKQTLEQATAPDTTLLYKGDLVDLGSYREFIHQHDVGRSFSFLIAMPIPKPLSRVLPEPVDTFLTTDKFFDPSGFSVGTNKRMLTSLSLRQKGHPLALGLLLGQHAQRVDVKVAKRRKGNLDIYSGHAM